MNKNIPHTEFFESRGYQIGGGGAGPAWWIKESASNRERQILISHPVEATKFDGEEGPHGLPKDTFLIGFYEREGEAPTCAVTVHRQQVKGKDALQLEAVAAVLAFFESKL